MRHQKFSQRLSRPAGHRRATVRNLVINLLKYQQIRTTKAKAKFTQPLAERLISVGKQNSLPAKRQAFKILDDRIAVGRLFSQIAPLFKQKSSGFTRIVRLPSRRGDNAEMVLLELTEKIPVAKPKALKKEKPEPKEIPSRGLKKPQVKPEEKAQLPKEKPKVTKKLKPKKFLGGLRKLFKKERDAL